MEGAGDVSLVLSNGRRVDADVLGVDADNDLAVLQVSTADAQGLRALTLGRSAQLRVGDPVPAVCSPLGLEATVTAGIGTSRPGNIGIGFAIPVDRMTAIVQDLLD